MFKTAFVILAILTLFALILALFALLVLGEWIEEEGGKQ